MPSPMPGGHTAHSLLPMPCQAKHSSHNALTSAACDLAQMANQATSRQHDDALQVSSAVQSKVAGLRQQVAFRAPYLCL
jgi:hypothetical protein